MLAKKYFRLKVEILIVMIKATNLEQETVRLYLKSQIGWGSFFMYVYKVNFVDPYIQMCPLPTI